MSQFVCSRSAACVNPFRPDIPLHVAEVIRSLHPDLKRSIKASVRGIATDQEYGKPLMHKLDGLWTYRVLRFRRVYAIERKARVIRLMAVCHRQSIYEDLTTKLRTKR